MFRIAKLLLAKLPNEKQINIAFQNAVLRNERQMLDINRKQLLQGLNAAGAIIQSKYSIGWARVRRMAGLQTNFVDLTFTQTFANSLRINFVRQDAFKIIDNESVNYAVFLKAKYPYILGIDLDLNRKEAKEVILNDFKKVLKDLVT